MENTVLDSTVTNSGVELDQLALENLEGSRKWTLFISIVGFVGLGLMLIMAIFSLFGATAAAGALGMFPFLIMIAFIGLYAIPIYYLYQFSQFSREAVAGKDSRAMSQALFFLRRHYKFMGILLIIVLSFYLIFFLVMLASGNMISNMFQPF